MLYKVEIENFYSIGERQVIDLRARKSVKDELGRLSPLYEGSRDRAPNVVALFGPNASGKSNVLRAMIFGTWFMVHSFAHKPNTMLPYEKFGSDEGLASPTGFAMAFCGPADLKDMSGAGPQCPYSYELVLGPGDQVILEKLSHQPRGYGKPTTIFERGEDGDMRFARGFVAAAMEKALGAVLRDDVSVLSTLVQLNHRMAGKIVDSLGSVYSNLRIDRIGMSDGALAQWYADNPRTLAEMRDMVRRIDLGIEEVLLDLSTPEPRLQFKHLGLDQIIDLQRESHGTRRCLEILPDIISALSDGGMAIIDELDTAIHPALLPEILGWFGCDRRNPHGAQLWMTCHAASQLERLTKEEVLFCKKDWQGRTAVYGLAEIEGVRRNEDFLGRYLIGEYGALPVIG